MVGIGCFAHRVIATLAKGVAAQKTPDRKQASTQQAMRLQGLGRVF